MAILLCTPKNLKESILNGVARSPVVSESMVRRALTPGEQLELAVDIEPYVRDFLHDRFTSAIIENSTQEVSDVLRALLRQISGAPPPVSRERQAHHPN